MPLVRVQVRNEYRLGKPELYREADGEDPEAVLRGVAVAGLVGILRQLGDLAEFAAEVFHGLQEQVMYTSSRSHKLMVRLQHMESALPPLEKVILAQKSHLHFAYTIGSAWHPRLQNEQNHFIVGDLPQFIMDSYEECRGPPRLHLLDKFDTGGPGSCLKRYSDPTFFRRASGSSGEANVERVTKTRKVRRRKKSRTWERNGASSHGASLSNHSDRMQFASRKDDEHASTSQSVSAFDTSLKSEMGDESNSFDSRTGSSYIECAFRHDENEPKGSSFSRLKMNDKDTINSSSVDEHSKVVDEKTEIVEMAESVGHQSDHDEITEMLTMNLEPDGQEKGPVIFRSVDQIETTISVSNWNQIDDIESEAENYVDALNTIDSESETELNFQTKREVEKSFIFIDKETNDGTDGVIAHHSDLQPSNLQSCSTACDMGVCESSGILDGSNVESVVSDSQHSAFTEPNLKVPMSDKSVMFWTNGSLLGLQPSKPPDLSVLNSVVQDSVTSEDNLDSPSLSNVDHRLNLSESSAVVPENEHAVTQDVNHVSCTEVGENRSPNGFRRNVSLVHGEKSESPSSLKTGVFSERITSPSSSPPLQHIKLSFHPVSAFESSKLKLKFPDGSFRHDDSRDLLPAFQLVPDLSTPRHDIDSDSDNTFCRSSLYMSDEYLSHHSDSNSEEWESDDTSATKNNELYGAVLRVSSAESVSDFVDIARTRHGSFRIDSVRKSPNVETCLEPCQSGRTLDLPSLSTLNPLFEQEMKIGSDGKDFLKLHLIREPTPLPPPLPSLEWRAMKFDSDVTIGKLDCVSETHNHAFERTSLGSTVSPQFKPSQSKQHQSGDETSAFTPKSKEWQKENQARNCKDIDEKEDFLDQIRSKSFRLRHTATEKPTLIPVPAANVKVTTILEKANAIRQAVGSDDDDNWSDT